MNSVKRIIILSFALLALFSCSTPETRIYRVHIPSVADSPSIGKTEASLSVTVSAVRYLTQPYIAQRRSPFQLSLSNYSKWYMPPDEMVREALREAMMSSGSFKEVFMSGIAPDNTYALQVYLKQFDQLDEAGESFGEVAFDFSLRSPQGQELRRGSVAKKVRLEHAGFLGLAQGLSSALHAGIQEVQAAMGKALSPAQE